MFATHTAINTYDVVRGNRLIACAIQTNDAAIDNSMSKRVRRVIPRSLPRRNYAADRRTVDEPVSAFDALMQCVGLVVFPDPQDRVA
jgi:hypothetical protein